MAYIIPKDSEKNGESRKLYYIARAYRGKLTGNPSRKIIFSLGLSQDIDTALNYRRAQADLIFDEYEKLGRQMKHAVGGSLIDSLHMPPNMQVARVIQRLADVEMRLDKAKVKVAELEEIKVEFPECSARKRL